MATNTTTIVTGKVRLSYVTLEQPKVMAEGSALKYSLLIVIPKSDTATVSAIKNAIRAAVEIAKDKKFQGVIPKNLKHQLKDADEDENLDGEIYAERDPEFAECYILNTANTTQPLTIDHNRQPIDPKEIYSGCYGRVQLNFWGYNTNGNKGISNTLLAVQKVADGEPLGGARGDADAFDNSFADEDKKELDDLFK